MADSSPLGAYISSPLKVKGISAQEEVYVLDGNFQLILGGLYVEVWSWDGSNYVFSSGQVIAVSADADAIDTFLSRLTLSPVTANGLGRFNWAAKPGGDALPHTFDFANFNAYYNSQYVLGNIDSFNVVAATLIGQVPGNVTVPAGQVVPDNKFDIGVTQPGSSSSLRMLGTGRNYYSSPFSAKMLANTTFTDFYITMNYGGTLGNFPIYDVAIAKGSGSVTVPQDGVFAVRPLVFLKGL